MATRSTASAGIENGTLVLGSNRYRAVVLPGVEHIPLDTYRKLEAFARGGGALIATRRAPIGRARIPGQATSENDEVGALSKRLFEAPGAPGHLAEDEKALSRILARTIRPDLTLTPAAPEIGFVHRKTADADVYFLANTSNRPQRTTGHVPRGPGPGRMVGSRDRRVRAQQRRGLGPKERGSRSSCHPMALRCWSSRRAGRPLRRHACRLATCLRST